MAIPGPFASPFHPSSPDAHGDKDAALPGPPCKAGRHRLQGTLHQEGLTGVPSSYYISSCATKATCT